MSTVIQTKELVKETKIVTVFDFMEQKRELISKALPKTITPDRLIGVFNMLIKSSPELSQCSQTSLIAAVIQTVQLGLTPGNIGHCHYVPFNNKKKDGSYQREVQFILGYRGIVELVNRCGKASILSTEIVYKNDLFEYALGLNPILKHIPTAGERGEVIGVYCVAKNLVANEKLFIYMQKEDIEKVKASSKAAKSDYSPWNTWYEEMAKKTVIKRICKILPLSVDEQRKIETDETIKNTIDADMADVRDEAIWNAEDAQVIETTAQVNGTVISEPQLKRLFAIMNEKDCPEPSFRDWLQNNYSIESMKEIKKSDYEAICKYAQEYKKT